jgi:hypothetical protein
LQIQQQQELQHQMVEVKTVDDITQEQQQLQSMIAGAAAAADSDVDPQCDQDGGVDIQVYAMQEKLKRSMVRD